jgi:site-specific recombinase XerD
VCGKGDKDRVVFLGNAGRRILWRYLTTRPSARQKDYLFPSKTNRRLDRNNLRETIQRVAERAGVSGVTIHRFRHTFAINFLRNGGSVLELQEMLGHEKMETVRIYAKIAGWTWRLRSAARRWRITGGCRQKREGREAIRCCGKPLRAGKARKVV